MVFVRENPMKIDDEMMKWGTVPLFQETPTSHADARMAEAFHTS